MAAPDPEAPAVLRLYRNGTAILEIEAHDGLVLDYSPEPAATRADADGIEREAWAVTLRRLDGEAGPYRVSRTHAGRMRCDCADTSFGRAKREFRNCKHRIALANLLPFAQRITSMAKRKPDEQTPAPAAPAAEARTEAGGQATPDAPEVSPVSARELARQLADPFPAAAVGWKPQTAKGDRALAVAYIDARDVMDRLDQAVGIDGWHPAYVEHADGTVTCSLSLRMPDGSWLAKTDVGGESEQKDVGDRKKAAYSDALKRAAVQWGVGRYLYSLPTVWADYDEKRRAFVRPPSLPAWALPGGSGRPPGVQATRPHEAQADESQPTATAVVNGTHVAGPVPSAAPPPAFHRALQEYDGKLAAQGLCKPGELVKYVAAAGKKAGYPADMTTWDETQVGLARDETRHFEQQRRQQQPRAAS